ncbi:MAG: hypothetical protein FWG63_08315 [Defluviitaleaceae bacterium]|nr:hypothetical protein [Defluviitaleaceae bacterium]
MKILGIFAYVFIVLLSAVSANVVVTATVGTAAEPTVSRNFDEDDFNAIGITVIIPPPQEAQEPVAPIVYTPRVFPVRVAEGYNYAGVRELVRVYELLPNESPEWINTESFERNGYYFTIADIVRQLDINHTSREHTEIKEVQTPTNNLANVINSLHTTMEFTDDYGYTGVLHLNIDTLDMSQDGTRTSNRQVTQVREYPHLHTADLALIPETITAGGHTYRRSNVEWRTNTTNAIDFQAVASTFTAVATFVRNATSTVSTGYTTTVEYSGVLTRIAQGEVRFVATFIGTPISGVGTAIRNTNHTEYDILESEGEDNSYVEGEEYEREDIQEEIIAEIIATDTDTEIVENTIITPLVFAIVSGVLFLSTLGLVTWQIVQKMTNLKNETRIRQKNQKNAYVSRTHEIVDMDRRIVPQRDNIEMLESSSITISEKSEKENNDENSRSQWNFSKPKEEKEKEDEDDYIYFGRYF